MYRCDNDTIVPVEYNCSSAPSPVCNRTGEMTISMADDTGCCPHKVCGEAASFQIQNICPDVKVTKQKKKI